MLKKIFAIASLAVILAACEEATPEQKQKLAEEQAALEKIRTEKAEAEKKAFEANNTTRSTTYHLADDLDVTEFRSKGDPNSITVVVDGKEAALGVVSFKSDSKKYAEPRLIASFETAGGMKVYEFQPASDTNIVCTYVADEAKTDLKDLEINFKHVKINSGALTYSRKDAPKPDSVMVKR